jgi:putative transposase
VLQDAQAGDSVQDLCRQHGILDATFLTWQTTYAGLAVSDVKTLRQLEKENRQLKQMVVEQALDIQALKAITAKTGTAQSETDCRHVAGGTRWAESTTSVSVSDTGSKYARYQSRRSDDPELRARMRGLPRPSDGMGALVSCAAMTGRVAGESQEGRADLSEERALAAPPDTEESYSGPPCGATVGPRARAM